MTFPGSSASAQSAFSEFSRDELETVVRFLGRSYAVVSEHLRRLT